MLTKTRNRVSANTAEDVNGEIHRRMRQDIARYATAGPMAIECRLSELDAEWDIERYLETMAPSFTLLGMTLGLTINRKWFVVPFVVQAFFLQHALQGWCPPVPILRRLGVRTSDEINQERYALKALRGDFEGLDTTDGRRAEGALAAVCR